MKESLAEFQAISESNKGKAALIFNNIYKTLKKLNDAIIEQKKDLNCAKDTAIIKEIK